MNLKCTKYSLALVCVGLMAMNAGLRAEEKVAAATEEAEESLVTDRPDFTESAETIPKGRVQVESGFTYERSGDARGQSFGEVLVRIPVSGRSELRIGVPSYLRSRELGDRASGFDDLFLGGKVVLKKGAGKKPAFALLFGTPVPTGSREVAERRYQPEVVLAGSIDLSERWALASNLGYVRASSEGERFNQIFGSVSLGHSLSERWGCYFEVFGFNRSEPDGSSDKFFNTGVTYLINNDFQLDARVGTGLNGVDNEYFWGLGASRRF